MPGRGRAMDERSDLADQSNPVLSESNSFIQAASSASGGAAGMGASCPESQGRIRRSVIRFSVSLPPLALRPRHVGIKLIEIGIGSGVAGKA